MLKHVDDPQTPAWISLEVTAQSPNDPELEEFFGDLVTNGLAPDAPRPTAVAAAIDDLVDDLAAHRAKNVS